MEDRKINRMIDHTLLRPEAAEEDIVKLCAQAVEYDFWSVCVNTHYVTLAAREVEGTGIKVCSISGFPLGAVKAEVKAFEALKAVEDGADEIDMVLNIGLLKSGLRDRAVDDIRGVVEACGEGVLIKVIIEAALLSDEEKVEACRIAVEAGAGFVKTSTGFGPPGADPRDVRIMREAVGADFGVKASAGIRTARDSLALIEAGANRIGTSAGVKIMQEFNRGDF